MRFHLLFRLCLRRFLSRKALPPFRGTFSLRKRFRLFEECISSVSALPPFRFPYVDAYSLVNMRFRSGKAFTLFRLCEPRFNSEIAFIAICSLSEPRFCSVNAFSSLKVTILLGKGVSTR